jgi:hypothetical protein
LTIDLPGSVRHGQVFNVVVRQVRTSRVSLPPPPPPPPPEPGARRRRTSRAQAAIAEARAVVEVVAERPDLTTFQRRILGAFQLTIPVTTRERILPREERALSVLRWIQRAIPEENRWALVFRRYVAQIGERVGALGGNPDEVTPSPSGDWHRPHRHHGDHDHDRDHDRDRDHDEDHDRDRYRRGEERLRFSGKVAGIVYDHFADFTGFLLDTGEEVLRFETAEPQMERLLERARSDRSSVIVVVEHHLSRSPVRVVVGSAVDWIEE